MKSILKLGFHVWLAGFVNVAGIIFQLYTLVHERTSEGLSLGMCFAFLYIQFVYGRLGQREGNKALMICMYTSFIIQLAVIIYAIILRHQIAPL